jgi:tetratricopeptide (TPR) repeat protein
MVKQSSRRGNKGASRKSTVNEKIAQRWAAQADACFMTMNLGRILLLFWAFAGLVGCSSSRGEVPNYPSDLRDPAALLKVAATFAARGESNRAEQYYVAALQAGAEPAEVYPSLVDACIQAGRLGSALQHAERHLRDAPDDLRLLRLSASLSEALGHVDAAREYAEQIARQSERGIEEELFLGAFFQRQQLEQRAQVHLKRYLALAQEEDQEPWVVPTLKRLEARALGRAEDVARLLDEPEMAAGVVTE